MDYCGSYLANLMLLGNDPRTSAKSSYGYYVAGITIVAAILFVPYWWLRTVQKNSDRDGLVYCSYAFTIFFILMYLLTMGMYLAALCHPADGNLENTFLYK